MYLGDIVLLYAVLHLLVMIWPILSSADTLNSFLIVAGVIQLSSA